MLRYAITSMTFLTILHSNTFPHTTFNWVGIDGTQVLCHMTPVGMCFLALLDSLGRLQCFPCRYIHGSGHSRGH